jgi:UDP-glucose 6-dehydrogenase
MKVTVFGVGYVGLIQTAVLAQVRHDAVCVVHKKRLIFETQFVEDFKVHKKLNLLFYAEGFRP